MVQMHIFKQGKHRRFPYAFNFCEWPREDFSPQYQDNIKQIFSDVNEEKYQLGDISWFNTKFSELTS